MKLAFLFSALHFMLKRIKNTLKTSPLIVDVYRKGRRRIRTQRLQREADRASESVGDIPKNSYLFFLPEAGFLPHFASLCVLAKTMQQNGHSVFFVRCTSCFSLCSLNQFLGTEEQTESICTGCTKTSIDYLRTYGLPSINLTSVITPQVQETVELALSTVPENPIDFKYEGFNFGKLVAYDLLLRHKLSQLKHLTSLVSTEWRESIHSGLLAYHAMDRIIKVTSPKGIVFFNDYFLALSARAAAEKNGVKCLSAQTAAHNGSDRRNLLIWPHVASFQGLKLMEAWEHYKDLSLSPSIISEIGTDILVRLNSQGIHGYSPKRSQKREDLYEKLGLDPSKKLVVAYTSSLCETVASTIAIEGVGAEPKKFVQPFSGHEEWLKKLTAFVENTPNVQLVVRVHPREDANHREGQKSEQLERLEKTFAQKRERCVFIWPKDPISSYDLGELADVVVVAWSTIGLEFARLGVPVLQSLRTVCEYPNDGFFFYEQTPDAYFSTLARLLNEPPEPFPIIRKAFRWYYLNHLGNHVSLADVIPIPDINFLPPFRMTAQADAIESIFEGKTTAIAINQAKLEKIQSPSLPAIEDEALRIEILRTLHFLVSGERSQSADWPERFKHITVRQEKDGRMFYRLGDREWELLTLQSRRLVHALGLDFKTVRVNSPQPQASL